MTTERDVVVAAAGKAQPELQRVAAEKGWTRTTERDLQRALENSSGSNSAAISLEAWPQVGRVDLMFPCATALELKWAKSGDTLANCVWDVAKLATALAAGRATAALILAGAPASHWHSAAAGTELFHPASFKDDDLVRHYASWWRFWCNDVLTRPVAMPAAISVRPLDVIGVELDGERFELRLAEVLAEDPRPRDHVCPHRWDGTLCRLRPWDPNGWGGLPAG